MSKSTVLLFLAIVVGGLLRTISISKYPPSLNWDEVSIAYNSSSLAKAGIDEWGAKFPLIFRAYGDYKLPVYLYLTTAAISLFGSSVLTIKLASIIAGTLLIPTTFFLTKKITSDTVTAFFSAWLVALAPWSIFTSRIALEANLMLLFFALGFTSLYYKKYSTALMLFCLCTLTYNSARILLPFWLLIYTNQCWKNKVKIKSIFPGIVVSALILVIVGKQMFLDNTGHARYKWVSIIDNGAINYINENRGKNGNTIYSKLRYNKVSFFAAEATKNYLANLIPNYIFMNGGTNYQFNIPNFPLLAPPLFLLLLLGIGYCAKHNKPLLFLFFISPLPSAITRDAPHILRGLTYIYLSTVLVSIGFHFLSKKVKTFILYPLLAIVGAFALLFMNKYQQYSVAYAHSWQYGYKEAVSYINNHTTKNTNIIITKKYGEPHEYVAYYSNLDPREFSTEKEWDYHADWYWVNKYKNITFINDWEIKDLVLPNDTLLVTSPNNFPSGGKIVKNIHYPNGQIVFQIIQYAK